MNTHRLSVNKNIIKKSVYIDLEKVILLATKGTEYFTSLQKVIIIIKKKIEIGNKWIIKDQTAFPKTQ